MKDILEEILAWKRLEVESAKKQLSPQTLHKEVETLMANGIPAGPSMCRSLADSTSGIIAEFKRKSPSKGWIHADVNPKDVVPLYAKNGAAALSILTDEKYFGGQQEFVTQMRSLVKTPILRKDFIVDEYQIFEAKKIGADAVLLIAAAMDKKECAQLARTAHELGLEILLELHGDNELEYADIETEMVGINNRNLGTFYTDVQNSFRLAGKLPTDRVRVSESGISNPATIRQLKEAGFRGFLIGECFMKEQNPGLALKQFIAQI